MQGREEPVAGRGKKMGKRDGVTHRRTISLVVTVRATVGRNCASKRDTGSSGAMWRAILPSVTRPQSYEAVREYRDHLKEPGPRMARVSVTYIQLCGTVAAVADCCTRASNRTGPSDSVFIRNLHNRTPNYALKRTAAELAR